MQSSKTNILLILDGCIQGNKKAQRRFFEHFYGLIRSTCDRYADSKQQSEEMLNDAFYQIFRSLDRYDTERKITSWIIGITGLSASKGRNLSRELQSLQKRPE